MKRLALLFVLLRAFPAFAQQGATAELTGRVSSSGQPLSDVAVTLDSDALQGARITTTGVNGGYHFALLPPADYRLCFNLKGFTPLQERFRVSLGSLARVDVELRPAAVIETITVESDRARAPADALIAATVNAAQLEKLPEGRDITTSVLLSSNVNTLGTRNDIIIAGAPSWDSLYLIDGVAVSEYLSGQPHNLFIEDAIDEIAVQTGVISAEYGRFTGGVVSTLTKRGGNEYRGSLRDSITNAAWTRSTPWPDQPRPLDHMNHKVEGTLGGFLLKDRLWFFTAGRKARSIQQSFTSFTNVAYPASSQEERWEAKVTIQITPAHSVIASYTNTLLAEQNAPDLRSSGVVLDLGAIIPNRWQPANLLALTYEGVLASNTMAEIRDSQKRYALRRDGGRSSDRILGTLIYARNKNGYMNAPLGCGICGDDARNSDSWSAKISHYNNTRFGNHTAVAGAEGFREDRRNAGTRSASDFNIQSFAEVFGVDAYPVFGPATLIVWTPPYPSPGAHFNSRSGYFNDRWDISNRFTVNVGMRYDRNHAADHAGRVIADDGALSPRLSALFDLRGDGRHRLVASYARYASKILEDGGSPYPIGIFDKFVWRYAGPQINASGPRVFAPVALARLFKWFDSVGGVQNRQYLASFTDPVSSMIFPHSLRSPAVDEKTLGYTMQFNAGYLRADYVMRDWRHFYAARVDTTTGQAVDAAGNKVDVAWAINDDNETIRSYRGLQLQGTWQHGRLSAGGGYTLSWLRGNDGEEEESTASSLGIRNTPLRLWYPEFLGYPQRRPIGYLSQDERHRARLWVGYDGLIAGRGSLSAFMLQAFDSGHPYSAVADIDPTGLTPGTQYEGIPPNPGYVLNQTDVGPYYFSNRGAFRTDDMFTTDLALTYEVPYRSLRVFLKADVLNLFDNAAVVSPGTGVITRFSGGAGSDLKAFNPFTEVPIEKVNYRLAPDFGKPTGPDSYQPPRTFRISLGARF